MVYEDEERESKKSKITGVMVGVISAAVVIAAIILLLSSGCATHVQFKACSEVHQPKVCKETE